METPNKTFSDLVGVVKSWIPWRTQRTNVSRDFWMPDQSCRVCYECDSQFTLFNRRHHCRLCGRVFCAKCTENSVPNPISDQNTAREDWERIRVCNYCFKQWVQGVATLDNGNQVPTLNLSSSPSAVSLASTKSSGTINSSITLASISYSVEPYQHGPYNSGISPHHSPVMENSLRRQSVIALGRSNDSSKDVGIPSSNQFGFCMNRSDDDDEDYGVYRSDSGSRCYPQTMDYYDRVDYDMINNEYESHKLHNDEETVDSKSLSCSPLHNSFDSKTLEGIHQLEKKDGHDVGDEAAASSSLYAAENIDAEPVDFENNGLLWLPPEPEDEEDEREAALSEYDDDGADATGEWGYFRSSNSFGSGEYRNSNRSTEEHKTAIKNVVGHFRALIAQLLQVENVPVGEQDDKESWLEIITSLSWEAATLLKPDTSEGGGMDPGGYVKIKCIASGRCCDSMVVKGVVCKKNVAHRRMTSKIEKPHLLILGGALEYQRVSNHLSSFDTLLQQEMDHLKMAVAKIDAHHPDILLVEKSVSRFAQEYLLAKDISLVLNIKRPLLERIARCTGAQIVPSIDNLSSQNLGYCDTFHVNRFVEDHGTAGQSGKKSVKTLMYFEGCPKPLGYTILLRGANGDELKKVKHVVQYGVFAAYHLAVETSFLADEGASLPELPLSSPITVALPDKQSCIDRSISTIPGFSVSANEKPQGSESNSESQRSYSTPMTISGTSSHKQEMAPSTYLPNGPTTSPGYSQPTSSFLSSTLGPSAQMDQDPYHSHHVSQDRNMIYSNTSSQTNTSAFNYQAICGGHLPSIGFGSSEASRQGIGNNGAINDTMHASQVGLETSSSQQDMKNPHEPEPVKEEFPPSTSDHQSILVSLSSRCVWKGTVCERSHLFRIKYYGSFDKPLGRFLRDHLFDQSYRCHSCDMPSEAHVYCYTHRQGTLTISVKKLPEFLFPGEKDGKIWMWHRCLRCPRNNGFPPATRRIVMSDAAWGLSFGKFLELSFSNHAAASRVASCGHSLHRDCLRFYGFGKMVACFRYASIDVHSVYLPPSKVDFHNEKQEWIQKETNEVVNRAELLFSEILNALSLISEKKSSTGPLNAGMRRQFSELEGMLHVEKIEFSESIQKMLTREVKKGLPVVDILEMNRLRRQLLFQFFMWDHRLIYAASLDNNLHDKHSNDGLGLEEKTVPDDEMRTDVKGPHDPSKDFSRRDSLPVDATFSNYDPEKEIDKNNDKNYVVIQGTDASQEQSESLGTRLVLSRALSEGQFPSMANLSDTLDAAWTGENHPVSAKLKEDFPAFDSALPDSSPSLVMAESIGDDHGEDRLSSKTVDNVDDAKSWFKMPFLNFYRSFNKNFLGTDQKLDILSDYNPVYISSFRESELRGGSRLLLPVGVNETVIPVYDDEPTSIISYALVSPDYHLQVSDDLERSRDGIESVSSLPLFDSLNLQSVNSFDETFSESIRSLGSSEDSFLSSRSSLISDPLSYTKSLHTRVSFADDGPLGKVRYTVTCYYAKRFEALRRICCPSELDYIRSLSRCKKWGAQGGKSNVFFAKTLDDRFIVKQVTKTELESFIKFAPGYFKYLSESIGTGSPTSLAKILGIYQVTSKHLKGGKETKMDVLVMENLLFGRNITRLYDLKGSSRSRYNADCSGSNKVLLDQNLIEAMPTSPIFVGNKAKRLLERAVWNDTSFLASVDVMDYSLLVGVDEEKHELVLGIIDFMRQYTWDKHLETWVKASGILGGPKNSTPTVISPKQYKKRFRKAMTTYFLMLPDQWSPPTIIPSKSQSDLLEENVQETQSSEL